MSELQQLNDEGPIIVDDWSVTAVIDAVVRAVLPLDLHGLVPEVVGEIAECPEVADHIDKRWKALSLGEGNLVVTEIGAVAYRVIREADETSRQRWH